MKFSTCTNCRCNAFEVKQTTPAVCIIVAKETVGPNEHRFYLLLWSCSRINHQSACSSS